MALPARLDRGALTRVIVPCYLTPTLHPDIMVGNAQGTNELYYGVHCGGSSAHLRAPGTGCVVCPVHTYRPAWIDKCVECGAHHLRDVMDSASCAPCPPGQERHLGSVACSKCVGGTAQLDEGMHCSPCPPGSYASRNGSVGCASCALGTSSHLAGAVFCPSCLAGKFSAATGATSCSLCSPGGLP